MIGARECRKLLEAFNSARSVEDLLNHWPSLGPKRAGQILELKESRDHVTFGDLVGIRGISSKTLGRLTSCGDHVTRIIDTCQYYDSIYGNMEVPSSVVSVDLGVSQVAVGHFSAGMRILEWERVLLELPRPYTPKAGYEVVKELINNLPSGEIYLLEMQSHRTSNKYNTGFMDVSLRLRLLESIFYAIGWEQGLAVHCVSPTKVARYFDLPPGVYRRKKLAAVELVGRLIGVPGSERLTTPLGNEVIAPEGLREYFEREKKTDDLSDCILQAIAFMEWTMLHNSLW